MPLVPAESQFLHQRGETKQSLPHRLPYAVSAAHICPPRAPATHLHVGWKAWHHRAFWGCDGCLGVARATGPGLSTLFPDPHSSRGVTMLLVQLERQCNHPLPSLHVAEEQRRGASPSSRESQARLDGSRPAGLLSRPGSQRWCAAGNTTLSFSASSDNYKSFLHLATVTAGIQTVSHNFMKTE